MKQLIKILCIVPLLVCSVWAGEWQERSWGWQWLGDCVHSSKLTKETNLNRQEFEFHYKFYVLKNLLDRLGRYEEVEKDMDAIDRISNEQTKMAQMVQLRQKLINLCGNSNSPQCAEVKERLADYDKCMAKLASEWESYIQGAKKIQAEAERIAADKKARNITNGRSKSSIDRVIRQNNTSLQFAYNQRLGSNPGMQGRIVVKWQIDEFGNVIDCKLISSSTGDNTFDQTVIEKVKAWSFGKIDISGDITEFEYPFVFSPY
jgi:TonB family protein